MQFCAQTMEVGGWAVRAFLFLFFFLPFLKPFPSNPTAVAHIQLLAIIPLDPPGSPSGVWASEDFLFVPDNPMLWAGSREEMRSQLPGDSHWEARGRDLFSIEQSQSKTTVCWEADRRILPAPSRAASLLSLGSSGQGLEAGGRKRSRMHQRRQLSDILPPSSPVILLFLLQSVPFLVLVGAFQVPYRLLGV